jgi:hypothetical protein
MGLSVGRRQLPCRPNGPRLRVEESCWHSYSQVLSQEDFPMTTFGGDETTLAADAATAPERDWRSVQPVGSKSRCSGTDSTTR